MIDLKASPFFLNTEQVQWVEENLITMTEDEKIGQILCPSLATFNEQLVGYYTNVLKIGSVMIRPFEKEGLEENISRMQSMSKIPMLVAANLENGGCGAIREGTLFANPMGCAATGNIENGYRLGKISCAEASSVGVNWAFAPIVDIDQNYHNPITNVRTFGSDPESVVNFARQYMKAAKEENVATTIKHFPGDGVDERDQHLLTSVNSLSYAQWLHSFGMVYQNLISDGTKAVMAGHISAPMVAAHFTDDEEEVMRPASQSKTLLTKLLRQELGFNGLIVTDSTLMVGYMQQMPRRKAIPYSIACGADVILFNRSVEEDICYLKDGLRNGILSRQRLDEAVTRVLAMKASLGLSEKNTAVESKTMDIGKIKAWTKQCSDEAVTLVKNRKRLLPLSPKNFKRIYLNVIENVADNRSAFAGDVKRRLEKEGFKVTLRKRKYPFDPAALTLEKITPAVNKALEEAMCNTEQFTSKYDMAMIVLNMQTASNATVVRVNWNVLFGMGNDLPWYAGEMPLVAVSVCNPYHLLDIPMADVYVNAYTSNEETLDAIFDKLMGRSEFKGRSPVDPFCGKMDTQR